jgi:hypothetical protein
MSGLPWLEGKERQHEGFRRCGKWTERPSARHFPNALISRMYESCNLPPALPPNLSPQVETGSV